VKYRVQGENTNHEQNKKHLRQTLRLVKIKSTSSLDKGHEENEKLYAEAIGEGEDNFRNTRKPEKSELA